MRVILSVDIDVNDITECLTLAKKLCQIENAQAGQLNGTMIKNWETESLIILAIHSIDKKEKP